MLKVSDIHAYYGKSYILQGVSLDINKGEIISLMGRNGVGKTTTLKSIIGLVLIKKGNVKFDQEDIKKLKTYQISRLGIGYVPQGRHILQELTVRENLFIGLIKERYSEALLEPIYEFFPILRERLGQKGGTLSGGEQQMLAIGRALVPKPKLILMDEPTEGLSPKIVTMMKRTIKGINQAGLTILLVEQKLDTAIELSHRIYIMDKGKIVYHSTPNELIKDETIAQKHLATKI